MNDADLELCLQRHQRRLRAYLAGMGVALDVVDDLAQEVFVDYYFAADDKPAEVGEAAWLLGMARHKALMHFRSSGRRAALYQRFAEHLEACTCPLERAAGGDEMLDRLVRCLDRLEADERQMVERYYSGEETASGIAQTIGRSASAVRMAMMRLREQLRRCLQASGSRT